MLSSFEQLLEILGIVYFPTILLLFIIFWAIRNPEKIERWASLFYRLGSFCSNYFAKKSIQSHIQSIINLSAKELNNLIDGIALSKVRIKWVKEASPQAFIEGEEVVIVVGYEESFDKILLNAVLAYLEKGILTKGSVYLNNEVREGLRIVLAEKILLSHGHTGAFKELEKQVSEEEESVKQIIDKLRVINSAGLLISVYLNELHYLARQIYPTPPNELILSETSAWLDFVYSLATKQRDEDIKLDFIHSLIKVDVILIGKAEKVSSFGETPYLVAVLYGFNTLGAKRVYLLARGAKNVKIGKKVLNKMPPHHKCVFQTEELLIMNSEKIPSMCCVLE